MDKSEILTGLDFVNVLIRLENDGTADVAFNDPLAHYDVQTPFAGIESGQLTFAARTGGQNSIHALDDIQITTTRAERPLVISRSPLPGTQTVYPTKPPEIIVVDTSTALDTDSVSLYINGRK